MNSAAWILFIISLGVCSTASWAGESDRSKLAAILMDKSGWGERMERFPPSVLAEVEKRAKRHGVPEEKLSLVRQAMISAFDPKAFRANVARHIAGRLSTSDITKVLQWLSAPLGEKITHLDEEASTPEAYKRRQSMQSELTANAERVKKTKRLDTALGATEGLVEMIIAGKLTLATLANGQLQPVFAQRPKLRATLAQPTLIALLYSYRSLSDEELDQYLAFAESGPSKRYRRALLEGFSQAVRQANEKFAAALTRSLKEQNRAASQLSSDRMKGKPHTSDVR